MRDKILDIAPCGYFSFFDDGSIDEVNQTLCRLAGFTEPELSGKNVEQLFTLPTRIFYQTHFFPLVRMQGHAEEIFITLLTKQGEHLPILLNATRHQTDGKYLTACAFIVVENRKKFEEELIAAKRAAEKALEENTALAKAKEDLQRHAEQLDNQIYLANKQNNELRQLNHVITHNLKEPLRKIMLFAGRLQESPLLPGDADSLERLFSSSVQLKNTVSALQQYIWLDELPAKITGVDLNKIFSEAVEKLQQEQGSHRLVVETEALPSIEGDEEQLSLLFYQVLSNAIKFRKEDPARVKLTNAIVRQNRFRNLEGRYQYEEFLRIEISDEGIGFDPASSETVFELFRKLHHKEGNGLGLALCRKITDNHFGIIRASSKVGQGTMITVLLPLKQNLRPVQPAGGHSYSGEAQQTV